MGWAAEEGGDVVGEGGVAAEVGYYDQAHLTTEFRALMGVAPGAFVNGKLPSATRCQVDQGERELADLAQRTVGVA